MNQRAATGRDNRRKAIIAVAREMFLDQGYETVSMSGIAAQLGGSKTTLWSYFPNKPALFMAVAEDLIEEYAEFIQGALGFDLPLEAALGRFGRQLLAALMSPPLTALMRDGENKPADIARHVDAWIRGHQDVWNGWLDQARAAAR